MDIHYYSPSVIFFVAASLLLTGVTGCENEASIDIPDEIAALENLTVLPADAAPVHTIELQKNAVFGDTETILIGRLGMSAVDEHGRVYIADTSQNVIHLFESDGRYLAKIGGEGDGPGEFRQIRAVQAKGDQLHIMDMNNMRISTFDLNTFRFLGDISIPFEFDFSGGFSNIPQSFYIQDADHFIIHFGISFSGEVNGAEPTLFGRVMNRETEELSEEKLYEFQAGELLIRREGTSTHMMVMDYNRQPKIFFTESHLIHAWTENLLFSLYNRDGSYSHAIYQPKDNIELNRNDVVGIYADRDEPWRSMVRNDNMPDTWPAFSNALADDNGRIWAALFDEDDEIWNWRVYTQDGELFTTFDWPRSKQIREIRNGYVYTLETDEKTGLVEIVKYQILLN